MESVQKNPAVALAYHSSLALIAFLIAIFPKMVIIGFIFMFLSIVYGFLKKQFYFKFDSILIAFVLLYSIYLVGVLFTHNSVAAGKYLEYKLSFILMPILFSFRPKFELKIVLPIVGLCLGVFAVSIWGLTKSMAIYSVTHYALGAFVASNFCIDHPTYFAAFVVISMAGIWYLHQTKQPFFSGKWIYFYIIFGVVVLFMSYAMAGILFFLLLISLVVLRWIYWHVHKWFAIIVFLISPFLMYFTVTKIPAFKDEINNSVVAFKSYLTNPTEYIQGGEEASTGDKVRLIMWTVTIKAWSKHPLGVGTGNVDEYLSSELKAVGQDEMALKNDQNEITYNPHNQFLQTGLEIGLFGIAAFLLLLSLAIKKGLRTKNWLLVLVVSSLIFNCLFESILQRQSGIVFFTFWICILVQYSNTLLIFQKKQQHD